ncbi:hypothetical protein VTK73DRAFT_3661 [Phialemonium thermophilum]|uniref:Uncharacterized protein n=1 Tax=Phialemonium thermophilum TaxID=223376 RepID=A0ABR3VGG5_9PEZI
MAWIPWLFDVLPEWHSRAPCYRGRSPWHRALDNGHAKYPMTKRYHAYCPGPHMCGWSLLGSVTPRVVPAIRDSGAIIVHRSPHFSPKARLDMPHTTSGPCPHFPPGTWTTGGKGGGGKQSVRVCRGGRRRGPPLSVCLCICSSSFCNEAAPSVCRRAVESFPEDTSRRQQRRSERALDACPARHASCRDAEFCHYLSVDQRETKRDLPTVQI